MKCNPYVIKARPAIGKKSLIMFIPTAIKVTNNSVAAILLNITISLIYKCVCLHTVVEH